MTKKINVKNTEITIISVNDEDFISLTDTVKAKDGDFLYQIGLETEIPLNF